MTESNQHDDTDETVAAATFVDEADAQLDEAFETPMSLEEYVDAAFENPSIASQAARYLVEAIEHAGKRTVIEEGEEKERWRFFDDPHNDGEHAVLGNTELLNEFVDDLRTIAKGRGKVEKIVWFDGPTATGKSEFKRCLINGLREYSKTEEGRRYTLEWNIASASGNSGLTYGEESPTDEDDWYQSPVQANPLSVFPTDVRQTLLEELSAQDDSEIPLHVAADLDPFCQEAYDYLARKYRREGADDLFSQITDPQHLRVSNYIVDVGQGIGVLHAEDAGRPKQKLVGSWMQSMLGQLDSRGRKNPQAFSYDGVLSQGNGLLTIIEDAGMHFDLLRRLLSVPEEESVKLDSDVSMDIDTQFIIISNPDLDAQLDASQFDGAMDQLKPLKRRLDKREFGYLTNLSLEAELIHRKLTDHQSVWTYDTYEDVEEAIAESVEIDDVGIELAPHTVEAAALLDVVSRLSDRDVPPQYDIVDKALIYDKGYLRDGDEKITLEDWRDNTSHSEIYEAVYGIPVTYTRDVVVDLFNADFDRYHADLPVDEVILPTDVLEAMVEGASDDPVFNDDERSIIENRLREVRDYIYRQQAEDVLDAMLHGRGTNRETIEEYVEHVIAWYENDEIVDENGEVIGPDDHLMYIFESEYLGRFNDAHYNLSAREGKMKYSKQVQEFREDLMSALWSTTWENRDDEFSIDEIDVTEIPLLASLLEANDWDDVSRIFDDFDPRQWEDPPSNTETEMVKEETIENMVELFSYSEASAELVSQQVMEQAVDAGWTNEDDDTTSDN